MWIPKMPLPPGGTATFSSDGPRFPLWAAVSDAVLCGHVREYCSMCGLRFHFSVPKTVPVLMVEEFTEAWSYCSSSQVALHFLSICDEFSHLVSEHWPQKLPCKSDLHLESKLFWSIKSSVGLFPEEAYIFESLWIQCKMPLGMTYIQTKALRSVFDIVK